MVNLGAASSSIVTQRQGDSDMKTDARTSAVDADGRKMAFGCDASDGDWRVIGVEGAACPGGVERAAAPSLGGLAQSSSRKALPAYQGAASPAGTQPEP